jgi:DNA-binding IclR family transcriptional regulator
MSTALRLIQTLEGQGFIRRVDGRGYMLGPALLQIAHAARTTVRLEDAVMPALHRIQQASQESAVFYVKEGEFRRCAFRVSSPKSVRDHAEVGQLLPIERGSPGRALLAFNRAEGEPPCKLPIVTRGERDPELASVSAPVLGLNNSVVGAIGMAAPLYRFTDELVEIGLDVVMEEAIRVTAELGGDPSILTSLRS